MLNQAVKCRSMQAFTDRNKKKKVEVCHHLSLFQQHSLIFPASSLAAAGETVGSVFFFLYGPAPPPLTSHMLPDLWVSVR